uniref:Conotoxin n=1 Tax=Globodera pallida TaxID=36090 RepID=A0A183BK46_GLOPA
MRDKVCRWPGEKLPCLQLHHNIKERVRTKCCEQGCSLEELKEEMCCMSDVCLRRCYPTKGYRLGSVY